MPGKVVDQITLGAITWHVQDNQVIRRSQHSFTKGRSCLTTLVSCYKMTRLVDDRKAGGVVVLDLAFVQFPPAFWRKWTLVAWMDVVFAGKKVAGWPGPNSCCGWS